MEPIDRTLRYPEPLSASLDHIVPLSKGGENSAENFQASHLVCNISIGNRKTGSELRPAPIWLGVEYCSVTKASDYLGIPAGRLRKLADKGVVPTMPREKHQSYRIPINFVEEAHATKTPQELFVDPRSKPKVTHRDLTCEFCKETVSVPIGLKSRRKFCSDRCYKDSKNQKRRQSSPSEPKAGVASKTCIICGADNPITNGAYRSLLCGKKECKAEHGHQKRMAERISNPECKQCGKAFEQRKRGGGQLRRYCSDECKKQSARDRAKAWHHANKKS
tara:strand:+ start:735 stop:1565 length:831 start_codon:yes stop_codon:yes gene_type:complete